MRVLIILLLACVGIASAGEQTRSLGMAPPTSGEKRVALVIGNSAYKEAPLKNPVNDAHDVASALRKLGFEVIEKTNVAQKEMNRAIVQFGEKLNTGTVALFYYAGHGMQVKGKNYLIPVDAQIQSEASVRSEAVDVDSVLDQLTVSSLNIVILDACRNNPFERRFRSMGGGLAQMDAPKGSLIAYATAPGKTAADGESRNGLYTQELLKHIQTPGLPLESVFKRVRVGVMTASGEAQMPWETSSLTGEFFFRPVAGAMPRPVQEISLPAASSANEESYWRSIEHSGDTTDFDAYLRNYPNGSYTTLAITALLYLLSETATAIDISGTWNPEHVPGQVYIFPDGSCTYKGFLIVTIGCKWSLTDPAKREFTLVWNHGYTDVVNLSADGQRLIGKNNVGDPVAFVRNK